MTREEIISMAREAGIFTTDLHCATASIDLVERFAILVAEREREEIAKHFEAQPHMEHFGREIADAIRERGKT
jgi:hypothetical protein